ncbi:ATP-binding protein [Salininema proteolyticum]|uniref:ATP-binding protein n=1 Tax=Salininema proteolyticum TaxID=1607685 RepID=A0ABV8TW77_9ACTN
MAPDRRLITRDHPDRMLRQAIDRTERSHGGLVLVTGEAGIGKTTFATDTAGEYADRATLLSAGSWQADAVPPNWLWTQILRALKTRTDHRRWAEDTAGHETAVDELIRTRPEASTEFDLRDALVTVLSAAAARRPVIAVLDDLHFADDASLETLAFVAGHTWLDRLLLIGTYRDTSVRTDSPAAARILNLASRATLIPLGGLDDDQTARLLRWSSGSDVDPDTAAAVRRRTGGNPFLIDQTGRLLSTGRSLDTVTAGMRDALHQRIDLMSDGLKDVLAHAALLGREFDAGLLEDVLGGLDPRPSLDEAVELHLVEREGERYAFAHDLVRESLAGESRDAASRRHAVIARALANRPDRSEVLPPFQYAYHLWEGREHLDRSTVVRELTTVACFSVTTAGSAQTERILQRAYDISTAEDLRWRVVAAIELASVRYWRDRCGEAWDLYRGTIEETRRDDPLLYARAALSLPDDDPGYKEEHLREAHRRLTGNTAPQRPDDLSLLVAVDEKTELIALTVQALAFAYLHEARRRGDPLETTYGLWWVHASVWGPGTSVQRRQVMDELSRLADEVGDQNNRLYAESLKWVAMLEEGDPGWRRQLRRFGDLVLESAGGGWMVSYHVDMLIAAYLDGDYATARHHMAEAAAADTDEPMFGATFHHYLSWTLDRAEGLPTDIEGVEWHPLVANTMRNFIQGTDAMDRGDSATARARLDAMPKDSANLSAQALWIELAVRVAVAEEDLDWARRLREGLLPYEKEWLTGIWGISVHGPVLYWLAELDAVLGDADSARGRLEEALASARAMEIPVWEVAVRARLSALEDPGREGLAENSFRTEHGMWALEYAGTTVHVPDSKGLRDLHHLLGRPGHAVAATRLLNPAGGAEAVQAASMGGDDVLDERARREYRRRLEELDEAIDAAALSGDRGKAARLERERRDLVGFLKQATGLGGRSRRLGDAAERARKTVTNRIRNAVRKIESLHPDLGIHLRESVRTGARCVYEPDEPTSWRL